MTTSVRAAATWAPPLPALAAPPRPNAQVVDHRPLPAVEFPPDPKHAAIIAKTMQQLAQTTSGREMAEYLQHADVQIEVVPADEYRRRWPGSGAHYNHRDNVIRVPDSLLRQRSFITTLAHEAQHAYDHSHRGPWYLDAFGLMGGAAKDAARAALRFDNPVSAWLDGMTARQNEDEVTAYRTQAQLAHELGMNESSWAHGQAQDGSVLPDDEIRASIAVDDLYRMEPSRRLLFGVAGATIATSAAALGVMLLASAVAKGSYLAVNPWPVYALGGALGGTWIVGDQIRARRLEQSLGQFNGR